MKKQLIGLIWLVLALVLTPLTFSQQVNWIVCDGLSTTDSISVYSKASENHKYIFFSVKDSNDSKTDSLIVERRESNATDWDVIGVYDPLLNDYDDDGILVPGNNTKKTFMINEPYPGAIRIRKINHTSYSTTKSRIQWSGRE